MCVRACKNYGRERQARRNVALPDVAGSGHLLRDPAVGQGSGGNAGFLHPESLLRVDHQGREQVRSGTFKFIYPFLFIYVSNRSKERDRAQRSYEHSGQVVDVLFRGALCIPGKVSE